MGIESIKIGRAGDDEDRLTVTLRGDPVELIHALVNGLPVGTLVALQDALNAELEARALRQQS